MKPSPNGNAPPTVPWGALIAVIAVVAAYSLTVGYVYPAVAFNLKLREYSSSLIGVQSAMSGVGILAGSIAAPFLMARFGAWRTAVASLVTSAVAITALGIIPPIALWFILRFIIGFSASALFIVSETWINQLVPNRLRGRIIGLYTSVIAGVFALGPMLINIIGFDGLLPFLSVAVLLLIMGMPLLTLRNKTPPDEPHARGALIKMFRLIPILMLGIGAFGFFDGAILTLWPVYALDNGITADRAAFLLTVLIIGNVIFQYPIGWLADRMSRRSLFTLCAAVGFFGSIMLPLVDLTQGYVVPYLIFWGALSFGVYTLAMTLVGEALTGTELVAANAGFGVMWGIGAIGGSALTGWLMDLLGSVGLPLALGAVFGALTLTSLFFPPIRLDTANTS